MSKYTDVVKLYVATFNRAPDSAGIAYWVNDSGLSLEQIAQSFFDQQETQALYPPNTLNANFVNAVYRNLFNRDAETDGMAYWVDELDSGRVSKQSFILAVINGALDTDLSLDATILTNKQRVGLSFALHELEDVALARSTMSGVTALEASVESAVASIEQTAPRNIISVVTAGVDGTYLGGAVQDVSSDGRYLLIDGTSSDYYPPDANYSYYGAYFRKDMLIGEVAVVSTDAIGTAANGVTHDCNMSDDGRYIVFSSDTTNLVDNGGINYDHDIFLKDMDTGELRIISRSNTGVLGNGDSWSPFISGDGRYAVFMSEASNLVADDTNNVADTFITNLQTGEIARISVSATGEQGDATSYSGSISADGQYVAFVSEASNLVAGDTNAVSDIFLWNRLTNDISLVSTSADDILATGGREGSSSTSISADGRYVAFISDATSLVEGLSGGENRDMAICDVYVKDTQTGALTVASTTAQGELRTYGGYFPSLSDDGTYVTFESMSPFVDNDTNFYYDVYIKNLLTGAIELVSVSAAGNIGNDTSGGSFISGDGQYVVFNSQATNLVPADNNASGDGFRVANPLLV